METESIYKLARRVKRVEQSLYNALRSVYEDAKFVGEIRYLRPHLPLLANLRCGLWYARLFDQVCYFKSTDGHNGNWSFSSTRLNLHVALLAAREGGCMIVDATRKGKRFPDSMSKTIPIWTCVLNRAIARVRGATGPEQWDTDLHLPTWVSGTEKSRIESLVEDWVNVLLSMTTDNIELLSTVLTKPLRPLWISQQSVIWIDEVPDTSCLSFTPIILVSASRPLTTPLRLSDADFSWYYIPGAADDEESWARGLTPELFWAHAYDIISSGPEECNKKVAQLVERDRVYRSFRGDQMQERSKDTVEASQDVYQIAETGISISSAHSDQETMLGHADCVIDCHGSLAQHFDKAEDCYLRLVVQDSKLDRFSLQRNLPAALDFARKQLREGKQLLVCCERGDDISVSICLAILVCCFDTSGKFDDGESYDPSEVTKHDVRQWLVYICSCVACAHPSRGMLKQVYNFACSSKPGKFKNAENVEYSATCRTGPF